MPDTFYHVALPIREEKYNKYKPNITHILYTRYIYTLMHRMSVSSSPTNNVCLFSDHESYDPSLLPLHLPSLGHSQELFIATCMCSYLLIANLGSSSISHRPSQSLVQWRGQYTVSEYRVFRSSDLPCCPYYYY